VWPYSGMNSQKKYFNWVKPASFYKLEELKDLVLEPLAKEAQ